MNEKILICMYASMYAKGGEGGGFNPKQFVCPGTLIFDNLYIGFQLRTLILL